MSPVPGIAAAFDRDSDLAQHPAVLVYHNFVSKDYIRENFIGISTDPAARPSLDGDCEIIEVPELGVMGVRLWAAVGLNEKIVGWWNTAEPPLAGARARPYQRNYGNGYTHLFVRYLLRIGQDVASGAGILAGKLPGMTGTYDIQAQGIEPPDPRFSPFATWEARMWQGYPDANGNHPLGIYYYGVRAPGLSPGVPGVPSSIGKYDGSGTPSGTPMTSGVLVPGVWHCIEQEVKLNTVKDASRRTPNATDLNQQLEEMLANANADGELRVWLDGELVYEATAVAFRGLDGVRIQSIPFVNIYQGGHGTFPKAPEHYDLCAMLAATEYIGPPRSRIQALAAPQVSAGPLSALAASMPAGTWAELIAQDIDGVVGVGLASGSGVVIPFANSAPWCPVRNRIVIVGGDHGDAPLRHIEYDDATNRWLLIDRGIGSHEYQQVAVDPFSGDIYQRYGGSLYRYTGADWKEVAVIPFNISQVASVALAWWSGPFPGAGGHGVLTVYSGNDATISAFDPTTGTWVAAVTDVLPGQLGHYNVVSAYSSRYNCLVYGGGNPFQGESPVERQMWRLNADLSATRMPDAPHHVGIYSGMNLVSDSGSGNIIALGFGEAWELNPSGAGAWQQMTGSRAPPEGLLSPNVPPNSVISCDVTSFNVVVYVDALRTRQPKCRMWVYKSGGTGGFAAPNYDGLWWNAQEAGWGLDCTHEGDVIFATWFTHDTAGNAWYLSMTASQVAPNTYAGTLLRTVGPPLDASPFDPSQVQRFEVGNGTLTFSDRNNGTFAYTVDGTAQTKPITRFAFGAPTTCTWGGLADLALATNYQGLWWGTGGTESGWGIAFTHYGDIVFAMWFTFDFTGAPLPLSATLTKVGPSTYAGTLIETSGPPFSAVPFRPELVTRTEVGTATVTFAHGNAATFSYQVNLGGRTAVGNKEIERLTFRAPGTVCR